MRRRTVIIVAIVMAVIGIYVFFIMPLSKKRSELKESLEMKYVTLQKYETFLNGEGKIDAEFKTIVKEVENMEANVVQVTNESLGFAKIQGYIQDFAEKSGIKILSIRPLSMVKYKHYADLPIQFEASGGINQLSEFIKIIDTSKRPVKIDKLSVSVMSMQMPGDLKIRMQVSGLMKL